MADRYLQDDEKTLQNKLEIHRDPHTLVAKEAVHVNSRLMELRANGMPRAAGFELVKAVHRYLFQTAAEAHAREHTVYERSHDPLEHEPSKSHEREPGPDLDLDS